jgi:hypothetical protein
MRLFSMAMALGLAMAVSSQMGDRRGAIPSDYIPSIRLIMSMTICSDTDRDSGRM